MNSSWPWASACSRSTSRGPSYLREHETELWTQLETLDREESLEALLAYERLFFEGLRRYLTYLEAKRQAA